MHATFAPDEEANLKLLIERSGVDMYAQEDTERHSTSWTKYGDELLEGEPYPLPPVWPYDLDHDPLEEGI